MSLQMLERRDLLEQFSLGVGAELLKPAGGDLEMECAPVGRLALHEQCGTLEARNQRRRQVGRDGRARHADREVRAQMRDEVRAHALGGPAGERLLESGERQARGLDRAQRYHHGALPAIARRRERDIH